MKKYFVVSLMKNGILGGGMVADDEAITYHTGKVTVPNEYRRLEMKYQDIGEATTSWHCLLPTVLIKMHSGSEYRFAVFFGTKRLMSILKDRGIHVGC